jgi:FkbM family methyltransferase
MTGAEPLHRNRHSPSPIARFVSLAVYYYLAASPLEKGKHRLWQTAARRFLVSQLKEGPWIRTSGLTDAEKMIFMRGVKEPRSVKFVTELLRPGMVAIDVGANIGYYALIIAECVGPTGRVHAFEPTPALADRLRLNKEINRFAQLTINECAVANVVGSASLQISADDFEANSLFTVASPDGQIKVDTVTLDTYAVERGIERIDFVKVDCEGAELLVLQGAGRILHGNDAPLILFECNPATLAACGTGIADLCGFLRTASYECYTLEVLRSDPEPVWNVLAVKPHYLKSHAMISEWGLERFDIFEQP